MSESRDLILKKYLTVCKNAVDNNIVFNTFKSNPDYKEVLEHLSQRLGQNHLNNIVKNNFWLLDERHFDKFILNDLYGNPDRYEFNYNLRKFWASPTTIQYISVLSNLIDRFKSLRDLKIIEIGGGYGGQSFITQQCFDVSCYHIIDLDEAGLLQEKYLKKLDCFDCVEIFSNAKYAAINYDLVISNYALSEVSDEDQLKYVKDILLCATHGYITCNQPLNGIELLKEQFDTLKIEKDIEGEREENYLITW